jgi:RNA polymerase sigma-70 factor, ECF subfamily
MTKAMPADASRSTELLQDALTGSPEALDLLYRKCAPRLLSYIRLRMGRSDRERLESGDILQAAFLKSLQHLDEFRGADTRSLLAWLARIAEREILDRGDYHRRQRRDLSREVPLTSGVVLPAQVRSALSQAILDERTARLERAMASLADDHREVILLRKFQDLPFAEVARRLGRSEDACRMLLARAMTALTLAMAGAARA